MFEQNLTVCLRSSIAAACAAVTETAAACPAGRPLSVRSGVRRGHGPWATGTRPRGAVRLSSDGAHYHGPPCFVSRLGDLQAIDREMISNPHRHQCHRPTLQVNNPRTKKKAANDLKSQVALRPGQPCSITCCGIHRESQAMGRSKSPRGNQGPHDQPLRPPVPPAKGTAALYLREMLL